MALSHTKQTAIALTFGLALLASAVPALARGGTSHGASASPMHSGSGTMGPGRRSPPGSGSGSSGSSSGHGGTSTSASGSVINTGPAPFTPLTPSSGPSDNLPPMQELPQIAPPLPQLPEQFSTGGSSVSTLALAPGSTGSSSTPGGGGKDLASCMGFWDRATHMSKPEWRAACLRTMDEYPSVTR
jgi:hypothetical protein